MDWGVGNRRDGRHPSPVTSTEKSGKQPFLPAIQTKRAAAVDSSGLASWKFQRYPGNIPYNTPAIQFDSPCCTANRSVSENSFS